MGASTTAGSAGGPAVHPAVPLAVLAAAAVAAAGAAALVLADRPIAAGVGTALGGALLVVVSVRSRAGGPSRVAFADATVERALDAVVLGAVAWAGLPHRPMVTGAALAALASSYLASYLRAKATGLGFPITGRPEVRAARWLMVSVGLLAPPLLVGALWTAAAISVVRLVGQTATVARRREQR